MSTQSHTQNFSLGEGEGGEGGVEWSNAAVMYNVCLMLKLCRKIYIIDIAKRSITRSPNLTLRLPD